MLAGRFSPTIFMFLVFLLLCSFSTISGSKVPIKIGKGYRLVSVEELPDGGLLGFLQIKQKNKFYGPDIPRLQLYVK